MTTIDILLPKMGESVAEATILKWLKQPGDSIEKDETLVEIGTDKVESDLPSEFEGTILEILAGEGDTVEVGQVIARMSVMNGDGKATPSESISLQEVVSETPPTSVSHLKEKSSTQKYTSSKKFLSPVVRKIAAEENILLEELQSIPATGAKGRISKKDLLNHIKKKKPQPVSHSFFPKKRMLLIEEEDAVETLGRMRQIISERMLESVNTIPHVTTFSEVDVTGLKAWRDQQKSDFQNKHNTKLTYTHIMMYEVVQTLKDFPRLNAWLNGGDEFIQKKNINLGFATALPDGNLIVPNVKACNDLKLHQLTLAVNQTAEQARSGGLPPDAIQHTTFTISNTGKFGSLMGTPLISVPQVAVLALGEIHRRPMVFQDSGEEKIGPRDAMMLSISYDHRVIDGAYAASFLSALKARLQAY